VLPGGVNPEQPLPVTNLEKPAAYPHPQPGLLLMIIEPKSYVLAKNRNLQI